MYYDDAARKAEEYGFQIERTERRHGNRLFVFYLTNDDDNYLAADVRIQETSEGFLVQKYFFGGIFLDEEKKKVYVDAEDNPEESNESSEKDAYEKALQYMKEVDEIRNHARMGLLGKVLA